MGTVSATLRKMANVSFFLKAGSKNSKLDAASLQCGFTTVIQHYWTKQIQIENITRKNGNAATKCQLNTKFFTNPHCCWPTLSSSFIHVPAWTITWNPPFSYVNSIWWFPETGVPLVTRYHPLTDWSFHVFSIINHPAFLGYPPMAMEPPPYHTILCHTDVPWLHTWHWISSITWIKNRKIYCSHPHLLSEIPLTVTNMY